ncbi:TPA: hypothetical protein DCP42_00005, partial [Patescibacteria group bacterium]|nr:hypothetical protein [Patescibacteria group bacterium]
MQTLDQTLTEVEPVFREVDDRFSFTHPSFQEVLTAKQFADEINSGALSVRDAWTHCWSYEEDAELWGLHKDQEWRALLPDWRLLLLNISTSIQDKKIEELVNQLVSSYLGAENEINNSTQVRQHRKKKKENPQKYIIPVLGFGLGAGICEYPLLEKADRYYNPFTTDYDFMFEVAAKNERLRNRLGQSIVCELKRAKGNKKRGLIGQLGNLRYFDPIVIELSRDHTDWSTMWKAIYALRKMMHTYAEAREAVKDSGIPIVEKAPGVSNEGSSGGLNPTLYLDLSNLGEMDELRRSEMAHSLTTMFLGNDLFDYEPPFVEFFLRLSSDILWDNRLKKIDRKTGAY